MSALRFRTEWEPAPGVSHPAFARTWARIEMTVGDRCLTTVLDHRAGATRTGIFAPAFVLAEWIAQNFWFVLNECEPSATPLPSWLRRHSMATGRQGMSLPRLSLFRDETRIVARWESDAAAESGRPVSFVEAGRAELEAGPVRAALVEFVDVVLDRLRGVEDPDAAALRSDWEMVTTTGGDDALVSKRAARLGLDAYAEQEVSSELARTLIEGVSRLPERTGEDLLDAGVTGGRLGASLSAVAEALQGDGGASLVAGRPSIELVAAPSREQTLPHQTGYALAAALRGRVAQPSDEPFDLAAALEKLRWQDIFQPDPVWAPVDPHVKGAIGMSTLGVPRLLSRSRKRSDQRSLTSRGLFALLTGATGEAPRLLTSAGTRLQAASRAFAAELLAPAAALRKRIAGTFDDERIEELAQEFDVAPMVIAHQVANHTLGSA